MIPSYRRVAVFGGVYSNHLALEAAIADARSREVDAILCLGDLGAFGPNPDRVSPLLREHRIPVVRGNYDDSIARGLADCQCGYTDPRDNHYARISYRYTLENTSVENRAWMADFPSELRFRLGGLDVLAFHGSPRRTNEFLWESTTPTHLLDKLAADHGADVLVGTHTGIHWKRTWRAGDPLGRGGDGGLRDGSRHDRAYVNVGALGRPANDGRTEVWYAVLEASGSAGGDGTLVEAPRTANGDGMAGNARASGGEAEIPGFPFRAHFVPVAYDHEALAQEMRSEELPEAFVETILTGWWTTCLEILPGKERAAGRF